MILLSEVKQSNALEAPSSSTVQREPMAAELDEYADAYFLSNRANQLQDAHRNLKELSWIFSPIMVAAGAVTGNFVAFMLGMSAEPWVLVGGGAGVGVLGALGFNLEILRRGRRAAEAQVRYETLEAELFPDTTKEIHP